MPYIVHVQITTAITLEYSEFIPGVHKHVVTMLHSTGQHADNFLPYCWVCRYSQYPTYNYTWLTCNCVIRPHILQSLLSSLVLDTTNHQPVLQNLLQVLSKIACCCKVPELHQVFSNCLPCLLAPLMKVKALSNDQRLGKGCRPYTRLFNLVLCPDHISHEGNCLVNQVEFLGTITGMW